MVARLVPVSLVEVVARTAGFLTALGRPSAAYRVERLVRGAYWGRRLAGRNLEVGRGVQLESDRIRLGDGVKLYDGSHFVTGAGGRISVGSGSHIGRMCVMSGLGGISVGRGCAISSHVVVYSSTADLSTPVLGASPAIQAAVDIGENVYVGMGARILPGVSIGDDAIVAAGAVVTRDVPAGHVAKGVPAVTSDYTSRRHGESWS